jgi:cytochrome c6
MKRLAVVLALAFTAVAASADDQGSAIFAKRCAACHGKDGKGQTPMAQKLGAKDLTALKLGVGDVQKVVADGKGKMSAFKGKLSEQEIHEVAQYVSKGLK